MKRSVQLLAEPPEEKIWAALAVLSSCERWVSIDELGDFLKARQAEAASVKYNEEAAATRYALKPGVTRWPQGWDDDHIARALREAVNRKLVLHDRREDGLNMFKAVSQEDHDVWGLFRYNTPVMPHWDLADFQLETTP